MFVAKGATEWKAFCDVKKRPKNVLQPRECTKNYSKKFGLLATQALRMVLKNTLGKVHAHLLNGEIAETLNHQQTKMGFGVMLEQGMRLE